MKHDRQCIRKHRAKKKNQDDLIAISKDLVINVDIYDLQIFHCMHTQLII